MNSETLDGVPVKDAATVVLFRKVASKYNILMGQRGKDAVFMPSKFVFPGGTYEENDSKVPFYSILSPHDKALLNLETEKNISLGLAATVIRELWEETGLKLVKPLKWNVKAVEGWEFFHKWGLCPNASELTFLFRAITPVGRPRRFDARFFLCDAKAIADDLDDFSGASSELSHLQWISIEESKRFDLPIITRIVLQEVSRFLKEGANINGVPFYNEGSSTSNFSNLIID